MVYHVLLLCTLRILVLAGCFCNHHINSLINKNENCLHMHDDEYFTVDDRCFCAEYRTKRRTERQLKRFSKIANSRLFILRYLVPYRRQTEVINFSWYWWKGMVHYQENTQRPKSTVRNLLVPSTMRQRILGVYLYLYLIASLFL